MYDYNNSDDDRTVGCFAFALFATAVFSVIGVLLYIIYGLTVLVNNFKVVDP
jgi:hypothetical protein